MIPSYPKVWNFGHSEIARILDGPVLVEEKVDGSQFSFRWTPERGFECRSKGVEIDIDAPPALFGPAVDTARSLMLGPGLLDGFIYRGEAFQRPKHNALAYDRMPAGGLILFDVELGEGEFMLPGEKITEAERLGLELVPQLHTGTLTHEDFATLLDTESVLGGQKIEGIVVKPLRTMYGRDGKALLGKHVSEGFKEVHRKDWKETNGTAKGDIVVRVTAGLVSESRWRKAVQHLRDADLLTDSPKDIGPLLAEVARDTFEEEGDAIRDALFREYERMLRKALVSGLPEWYKSQLVEKQFGDVE